MNQCDLFWSPFGLLLEELVDAPIFRVEPFGLIPLHDDLLSLGLAEQVQMRDRSFTIGGDFSQYIRVMAHQPLDRLRLKQVSAVLYFSDQLLPLVRAHVSNGHR